MEHVLYISDFENLKRFCDNDFDRIYFGNEFCERLIPKKNELKVVLKYVSKINKTLTFMSPWCTNKGVNILNELLDLFPEKTEVVFNDWGAFELIKSKNLIPIMGRLLIKVRRDVSINSKNPKIEFFRYNNLNTLNFQRFLLDKMIYRVELDNVLQGYSFALNKKIKASLYYPFVFIASSKKCIFSGSEKLGKNDKVKIRECNFECKKYQFLSNLNGVKRNIIMQGNSHFYFSNKRPSDLSKWNIDRLVYIPKLF